MEEKSTHIVICQNWLNTVTIAFTDKIVALEFCNWANKKDIYNRATYHNLMELSDIEQAKKVFLEKHE